MRTWSRGMLEGTFVVGHRRTFCSVYHHLWVCRMRAGELFAGEFETIRISPWTVRPQNGDLVSE